MKDLQRREGKTKNLIQTIGRRIKKFALIFTAIPFFIAVFIHIDLPKKPKEVIAYEIYLYNMGVSKELALEVIKDYSLKFDLSVAEYHKRTDIINNEFNRLEKINDMTYDSIVDENRIFGFRTLRLFLIGFGTRVNILFISVIFFISLFVKDANLNEVFKLVAISFVAQGLYVCTWFLWDGDDYPNSFYYTAIAIMSIVGTFLTYLLITRYESHIIKLKGTIQFAIKFYWVIRKKFIKPEDDNEFLVETGKTIIKINEKV